MAASGCASIVASTVSRAPAVTAVSGLRASTNGESPRRAPRFVAAEKPRLVGEAIRSTSGKSAATMSAVPSSESLSTRTTVIGTDGGCARRASRQARTSSRQR